VSWLFVYGTLRRGEVHHQLLAGQRWIGPARTVPRYRLVTCRGYPALIAVEDEAMAQSVSGEVWEVTPACLQLLDEFEEVPDLYVRQPVLLLGHWPPEVQAYFRSPDCLEE
jgi:gamma-glutamylcyclotransferase (GGCT)/AIG2-like uncharacterized protein YtfP